MQITQKIRKILKFYEGESLAVKTNLARLLMHGALKGTGRLIVFAVDQGFEHGPDKMFAMNEKAYDPHYFYHVATKYGLSALAAPFGLLASGAETFLGSVPLILKLNSNNLLMNSANGSQDQALTSSVDDAVHLGCVGVGFTIYPGSDRFLEQLEELKEVVKQARSRGLFVVVWSYVRGDMDKEKELSIDLITYGAHMACLMGAHIVKVKIPNESMYIQETAKKIKENSLPISRLEDRINHVVRGAFDGRRMVIFSGGDLKDEQLLKEEICAIKKMGGSGSIIGRNFFQRSEEETKKMIKSIQEIYVRKD